MLSREEGAARHVETRLYSKSGRCLIQREVSSISKPMQRITSSSVVVEAVSNGSLSLLISEVNS